MPQMPATSTSRRWTDSLNGSAFLHEIVNRECLSASYKAPSLMIHDSCQESPFVILSGIRRAARSQRPSAGLPLDTHDCVFRLAVWTFSIRRVWLSS